MALNLAASRWDNPSDLFLLHSLCSCERHATQFAQDGEAVQFASRTLRLDPNIALAYAYSLNPTVKSTCDQLLSMYLDGLCCDVNVVLDVGTVLGTHRALLAARSPVFSCVLL